MNTGGSFAKLDNGFTELIDYAIGNRYRALEFYPPLVAQHFWRI